MPKFTFSCRIKPKAPKVSKSKIPTQILEYDFGAGKESLQWSIISCSLEYVILLKPPSNIDLSSKNCEALPPR